MTSLIKFHEETIINCEDDCSEQVLKMPHKVRVDICSASVAIKKKHVMNNEVNLRSGQNKNLNAVSTVQLVSLSSL